MITKNAFKWMHIKMVKNLNNKWTKYEKHLWINRVLGSGNKTESVSIHKDLGDEYGLGKL